MDQRSDIWSFGVILFELFSAAVPFQAYHHIARMYSILNEEPKRLENYRQDVPEQIEEIIGACLQKDVQSPPGKYCRGA